MTNMPRDGTRCEFMSLSFTIAELRQFPQFFDTVADRIWQTWWKADGHALAHISARLRESCSASSIPFALVAHDGAAFLGTASVIASDLAERPQLTPWVAAVWVEESARRQGVGGALVDRATQRSFDLGFDRVYLCARQELSAFYEGLGWTLIERDIGPRHLSVFIRLANPKAGPINRSPP